MASSRTVRARGSCRGPLTRHTGVMWRCSSTSTTRAKSGSAGRTKSISASALCWRPPTESDTRYGSQEVGELADVVTGVRNHFTLSIAGRLLESNAECYVKSPEDMQALFADLPLAISNTVERSSRLEFTLEDLGYEFPRYP